MDKLSQINDSVAEALSVLHKNPVWNGVISVAILMYASLLAPALPNKIIRLFDTIVGKLLFIFLIAYVSGKNISVALVLAVAFTIFLMLAQSHKSSSIETFVDHSNSTHAILNEMKSHAEDLLRQINALSTEMQITKMEESDPQNASVQQPVAIANTMNAASRGPPSMPSSMTSGSMPPSMTSGSMPPSMPSSSMPPSMPSGSMPSSMTSGSMPELQMPDISSADMSNSN